MPYSNFAWYNWRVEDGVVARDGFVRRQVGETWKKIESVGKMVAGAKINIESNQCTNQKL